MQNAGYMTFQFKLQKSFDQFCKVVLCLTGRHQVDEDIPCCLGPTYKQMAQIALMAHLAIIAKFLLTAIFQNTFQNLCKILMDNFTVPGCQHVIGTALFMKSKCQRTVFDRVAKGELHFIPVTEFQRTSLNSFKYIISLFRCIGFDLSATNQGIFNQRPDLSGLHRQLIFIRHCLIHAAAAGRKRIAHRLPYFPL